MVVVCIDFSLPVSAAGQGGKAALTGSLNELQGHRTFVCRPLSAHPISTVTLRVRT